MTLQFQGLLQTPLRYCSHCMCCSVVCVVIIIFVVGDVIIWLISSRQCGSMELIMKLRQQLHAPQCNVCCYYYCCRLWCYNLNYIFKACDDPPTARAEGDVHPQAQVEGDVHTCMLHFDVCVFVLSCVCVRMWL